MFIQKILEVFKAGKYPQGEFSEKELSELSETYNPKVHEAPLVVGHTSDYQDSRVPAYGWVQKVIKVGGVVKVIADFTEELAHMVKSGHYKKVSVGLYRPDDPTNPTPGKWHLHHVAFLGAAPPAVKGLEAIAFSEAGIVEMEEVEAVTSEMNTADTYESIQQAFATALSKIEDALKSDWDDDVQKSTIEAAMMECYSEVSAATSLHFAFIEKAEGIMEKMKSKAAEMVERLFTKHTPKESDAMDEKKLQEERDALAAEKAKLDQERAEFSEAKKKHDEAEAAKAEAERKARNEQTIAQFREECKTKNLPVNKMEEAGTFKLAAQLLEAGTVEFSETDKRPAFEVFKSLVAGFLPVDTSATEGAEFTDQSGPLAKAAESLGLKPGQFLNQSGMEKVAFAQAYVAKHGASIVGDTEAEKLSVVLTKMGLGEIQQNPDLLK